MIVLLRRHLAAARQPTMHTTSWRKPNGMLSRICLVNLLNRQM